ncbi:UNVERIFIED_CONTAM: Tol biopolymer transport system component [Streptomyces canus]
MSKASALSGRAVTVSGRPTAVSGASSGTALLHADPDPQPRVYRFEFDGGTTDVVSAPSAGPAGNPSIDHDGRYIAFQQGRYVSVRDLGTGTTTARVRGAQPSISGHGTEFAYASGRSVYLLEIAPDLVEGDTNGVTDIFLRTVR